MHAVSLQPIGLPGVPLGPVETAQVEVADGRNTYVLASFPSGRLAGQIVMARR
jgi:hypothetical protein